MEKRDTGLPGVFLLAPRVYGDARGSFMETYSRRAFSEIGIVCDFVQDNESFSAAAGTLRGIHFQNAPHAQAKLVRVARGAVLDVAVDLRRGSPAYLQWTAVELSEQNHRMLFLPKGFGHAFLTLTDDVLFSYKVDAPYCRESERCVRFDDPDIGIDWGGREAQVMSEKDRSAPFLSAAGCNFIYGEV